MPCVSKQTILFLLAGTVVFGCILIIALQPKPQAQQRPNIIIIMADDLGWNDVSFHGANQVPTPNIDALAYNGVISQRHYVLPFCTPSRTAFLTGRYPIRTGMQGSPLQPGEPRAIPLINTLLPEYLQKLGYATHLVGKWHVGYYTNYHTPTYRGFDTFLGYYSGYITYFNHTIEQQHRVGHDLHYDSHGNLSVKYDFEYMTDLISKRAEDIISSQDPSTPLYLHLSHLAAHSSNAKEEMEVRDTKHMNDTLSHIKDFNRRKLAGVVTALDESVGRIVQALRRADMLKNSIIVFMSDNGAPTMGMLQNFGSNYPLRGLKSTLFEGGVRGVACIYSPLIKNPRRISNELIHIADWVPTLYSAAGGNLEDLDENLDGVNQWATIVSGKVTLRKSVLLNIEEVRNTSAALMGRYKLINGAEPLYNGYYGDSGTNNSYPEYNVSSVFHSPAGVAIADISDHPLSVNDVIKLREDAKVLCNNVMSNSNCTDKCLFDVYDDPCETMDLSADKLDIVNELNDYIAEYKKVLMYQTNKPVDPNSFPEYFNGTWMPWLQTPIEDFKYFEVD
ncbi:arylsulfatase I [Xylocopa sonorina]|uniref:arylsulfatase I n=1 Tax=Xylocopa sonorina TaxID=1818115 RepID=UPI00403AE2F1